MSRAQCCNRIRVLSVALAGVGGVGGASTALAAWSGGDPSPNTSVLLASFYWTTGAPSPGYQDYAFDNFVWTNSGGGMVDTIGGFYASFNGTPITGVSVAGWEIRSGMSAGNGGTLVASGSGAPIVSSSPFNVGQIGNPFVSPALRVELDVPDFALAPGNYWIALSIGDAGTNSTGFVVETTGTSSIGSGIDDGQAIYFQGDGVNPPPWNYVDVTSTFGGPVDLAYFITEVPAPGAGAACLLGLAGLAAGRRRRA